jgi:hypothetical protein
MSSGKKEMYRLESSGLLQGLQVDNDKTSVSIECKQRNEQPKGEQFFAQVYGRF